MSIAEFLVFFLILFYKSIISPAVIIPLDEKPVQQTTTIPNNDILDYAQIVETYMKTKKPYLNPCLTIKELSDLVDISERILSQVINRHFNKNFYSFVNSYRVEEAKTLLLKPENEKSTMYAIACDSGFNTKSVFNDAFKKQTGMSPTEFRQTSLN